MCVLTLNKLVWYYIKRGFCMIRRCISSWGFFFHYGCSVVSLGNVAFILWQHTHCSRWVGFLSMVITCEDIILFWKLTYCIFNTVMSANEQVMSIKLRIDEWDSGQRRGLWGGERNILETDGSRGQGNTRRRKGDCRRRSKRARWVRLLRGVGEKNGNWRRHRKINWRLQKWECYDVCAELRSRKRLRHEIIRWTTKVGELDRMVGQSWYCKLFDGFVLLKASRIQIHLLPEWQLWGTFLICINPRWPSLKLY